MSCVRRDAHVRTAVAVGGTVEGMTTQLHVADGHVRQGTGPQAPAVLLQGVRKSFGDVRAVRGIDLRV